MILSTQQTAKVYDLAERARCTFPHPAREAADRNTFALTCADQFITALIRVRVCQPGSTVPVYIELRVDHQGQCPDEGLLEAHENLTREEAA